jgi:acetyl esterase/lipase
MQDGQRAIRWVRSNAGRYRIDPRRVGMMGFSAGGHLASTVATHYDAGNPSASDSVERQSCKPDFQILLYPVITMNATFTHAGSRTQLLGSNPSQTLVDLLSNELQVTPQTPPAFLTHGNNDAGVLPRNSQAYHDSCRNKGVSAELHLLNNGPHGFGMADGQFGSPNIAEAAQWPGWALAWMNARGFLTPTAIRSLRGLKAEVPQAGLRRLSDGSLIVNGVFNLRGTPCAHSCTP